MFQRRGEIWATVNKHHSSLQENTRCWNNRPRLFLDGPRCARATAMVRTAKLSCDGFAQSVVASTSETNLGFLSSCRLSSWLWFMELRSFHPGSARPKALATT